MHAEQREEDETSPAITAVLVASADYCFLRAGPGDRESPILVMVDSATVMTFVQPVSRKGAEPEVIEVTMHDLEIVGRRESVLRTDRELATTEVAKGSPCIMLENSPVGESPASGATERALIKDAVEKSIGAALTPMAAVLQCMEGVVRSAAARIHR